VFYVNQGPYRAECPRCGVKLSALTAKLIMNKMEHHARLLHGETIEWGPGQTGVPKAVEDAS
jgi:hypothetical protein